MYVQQSPEEVEAEMEEAKAELHHFEFVKVIHIFKPHGLCTSGASEGVSIVKAWDGGVFEIFGFHLHLVNINVVEHFWLCCSR